MSRGAPHWPPDAALPATIVHLVARRRLAAATTRASGAAPSCLRTLAGLPLAITPLPFSLACTSSHLARSSTTPSFSVFVTLKQTHSSYAAYRTYFLHFDVAMVERLVTSHIRRRNTPGAPPPHMPGIFIPVFSWSRGHSLINHVSSSHCPLSSLCGMWLWDVNGKTCSVC